MSANVPARRKAYVWFIILAIAVFVIAAVDILFLDAILKYGVYGALIVLFILAIIMLFAAGEKKEKVVKEDLEPMNLDGEEHLHCPHCAHVFAFERPKNARNWKRTVAFSCPECGNKGVLPPLQSTAVAAVIPGGEVAAREFQCGVCKQGWSVGVIGHRLKKRPNFDACPSCGSGADIRIV